MKRWLDSHRDYRDELGRIEKLWVTEAKRRRDEVRSGKVKTIPGPEALRKVRDTLRR